MSTRAHTRIHTHIHTHTHTCAHTYTCAHAHITSLEFLICLFYYTQEHTHRERQTSMHAYIHTFKSLEHFCFLKNKFRIFNFFWYLFCHLFCLEKIVSKYYMCLWVYIYIYIYNSSNSTNHLVTWWLDQWSNNPISLLGHWSRSYVCVWIIMAITFYIGMKKDQIVLGHFKLKLKWIKQAFWKTNDGLMVGLV